LSIMSVEREKDKEGEMGLGEFLSDTHSRGTVRLLVIDFSLTTQAY